MCINEVLVPPFYHSFLWRDKVSPLAKNPVWIPDKYGVQDILERERLELSAGRVQ